VFIRGALSDTAAPPVGYVRAGTLVYDAIGANGKNDKTTMTVWRKQ
jgi:hypothetical protein